MIVSRSLGLRLVRVKNILLLAIFLVFPCSKSYKNIELITQINGEITKSGIRPNVATVMKPQIL